jgi:hypothetical protein
LFAEENQEENVSEIFPLWIWGYWIFCEDVAKNL